MFVNEVVASGLPLEYSGHTFGRRVRATGGVITPAVGGVGGTHYAAVGVVIVLLGVKIIGRQLLRPAEGIEGLGDADAVIREGDGVELGTVVGIFI